MNDSTPRPIEDAANSLEPTPVDVRPLPAALGTDTPRPAAELDGVFRDVERTTGYAAEAASTSSPRQVNGERYPRSRLHAVGGIGEVWLARDEQLQREVALKVLRPELADQAPARERFSREAAITGQLEHPGIVPVYEMTPTTDGPPGYVMRFIRGRTFSEAIEEYHRGLKENQAGAMQLRSLLDAFVSVCNAVAFAHSRGVLHRDLKPQNVVLGDFGEVIVLDWGLAKRLDTAEIETIAGNATVEAESDDPESALTVAGTVLGTPAYMSPEQAAGEVNRLDQRTDVWSLGVILFRLLSGRLPFTGRSKEVLRKIQQAELPLLRESPGQMAVPAPLEAICRKAMARRPANRYTSVALLASDVRRWLADEPVEAFREPARQRLARWARHHQPLVASAAGVLLTLVSALTIGIVLVRGEQSRTEEERRQAVIARQEADANADDARAAEQQADRHARAAAIQRELALETLQTLVTDVQEQLRDTPDTQKLKEGLLTVALTGLERVAGKGEDSRADLTTAEGHQRMGDLFLVLGQPEKAQEQFEQARKLAETISRAQPKNPAARRQLAAAYRRLGSVRSRLGQLVEARKLHLRGRELLQALLGEDSTDSKAQEELVKTANALGNDSLELNDSAAARDYFREALLTAQKRADREPKNDLARFDLANVQVGLAQVSMQQGEVESAHDWANKAFALLDPLERAGKKGAELRHGLGAACKVLAEVRSKRGELKESRELLERSLKLVEQTSAADPKNTSLRRILSFAHNRLGDECTQMGALDSACEHFEKSIAIMQELVEQGRGARDRNDLALAYLRLGHARMLSGKVVLARTLFEKCPSLLQPILDADPKNAEARRDLAMVHSQLGQICEKLNDSRKAREHHQECIKLVERLVKDDPKNARNRTDLVMAYNKLADLILHLEPAANALPLFEKAQEQALIVLGIAPKSRSAQADVALGHMRLADAHLRLGKPVMTEAESRKAVAMFQQVVAADEKNLLALRHLGYSWQILGRAHIDLGQQAEARKDFTESITRFEKLVLADARNALFKDDLLSAYNKLGDLLKSMQSTARALDLYEKALGQARAVHELDPGNPHAQYNLALSYLRIADLLRERSRLPRAKEQVDLAMKLLRPLVADDADNLVVLRDMGFAYQVLGLIQRAQGNHGAAYASLTEAIQRMELLHKKDPRGKQTRHDLFTVCGKLGDLCGQILNDLPAAKEYHTRANILMQSLAADDGSNGSLQFHLGGSHFQLGLLAFHSGEGEEALKQFATAEALLERVAKSTAMKGDAAQRTALDQVRRMRQKCQLAQRTIRDLELAMKQPKDQAAELLIFRVRVLARRGDHAEAAVTVGKLAGLSDAGNPMHQLAVARCHALCAAAVAVGKKPETLTNTEQEARANHVARALATLKKAIDTGFKDLTRLEADSDLSAIRSEEGFRALVASLRRTVGRPF